MFFFLIITAIVLSNAFWWRWADVRLRGRRGLRALLAIFMAGMLFQLLWIMTGADSARAAHLWLPRWYMVLVYLWHLLVLPGAVVLAGLGTAARLLFRRPPYDPSRRSLLKVAAACFPPVAAGAGIAVALPRLDDFRLRKLTVPVPGLPEELDGLRIAHVSDLHYGKYTQPETVDRIVAAVNGLEADLVLFTGDLIDLSLVDLDSAMEMVARLDRRSGLFLCEGNHDLIDDGEEFRRRVRAAGLPFLRDEAATVKVRGARVQVLGSRWGGRNGAEHRSAIEPVRALRDPAAFPVLLSHHPHAFDDADGFPLTLSGHTHGGQLMLNERLGAGPVLFRYWSGLYRRDGRALVVSNGIGNWFPVRTRAPAEVGHYTLARPVG